MNAKLATVLIAVAVVVGVLLGRGTAGGDEKMPGPGPSDAIAGVPVGYERSKVGAVHAALGFESALAGLSQSSPSTRRLALDAMTVPSRRHEVMKAAEEAFAFFDKEFGPNGVARGAIVGYRVKAYDKDAAEIELWEVSVVGHPDKIPARSGWSTRTVRLRWANDDWKLAELPSQASGPTPQLQDVPSDPKDVIDVARQLQEVRNVPAE